MKHAKIRKFPIILIVIILLIAVAVTAILLFNNYKLDKLKHMSDLYFMNLVEEQQIGKKEMDINLFAFPH